MTSIHVTCLLTSSLTFFCFHLVVPQTVYDPRRQPVTRIITSTTVLRLHPRPLYSKFETTQSHHHDVTSCYYTVSQKNVPPLTWYNLGIHNPITILAEMLQRKSGIIWCFVFPPQLSSASALPCEIGNPEDSVLVYCACKTVQLL